MDFDKAIEAHTNWKLRLRKFFDSKGTSEEFDVQKVCKDNLCDLGKWIYTADSVTKSDPNYEELRTTHAEFHVTAAEIIKSIASGKQDIESLIGSNSRFSTLSSKVVTLIRRLRKAAQAA